MCKNKGVSSDTHSSQKLDDYANQNNPNSDEHQANLDNHANQMNPNHEEYRGNK